MTSRIDLLSVAQGNLPVALNRQVTREELDFLDREVIPRLFAASIALLALLQAAAHVALSTTHLVFFLIALSLDERETYLAIFDRAKSCFFYALEDASIGVLIFHSLWDPEQVVQAAFPLQPAATLQIPPAVVEPAQPVPVPVAASIEPVVQEMPTFHHPEPEPAAEEQNINWVGFDAPQTPAEEVEVTPAEAPLPSVPRIDISALQAEPIPMQLPAIPEDPYLAIVEPPGYAADVAKIMEVLAKAWTSSLAKKTGEHAETLTRLGTKVKDHRLHTLKFIECIVRDPSARKHLASVQNAYMSALKWNGFLWGETLKRKDRGGTGGALDDLAAANQLLPYLDGFVKALSQKGVKISSQEMLPFIEKCDWEAMFKRLLSN